MVYRGTTPALIENITPGKHYIRLTLSGYHDYDAPVYVTVGETEDAFGTLQPLGISSVTPVATPATPIVVTVPVTAEPTPAKDGLDSSIIVAVIGVVTASIGAVATLLSHKAKKE